MLDMNGFNRLVDGGAGGDGRVHGEALGLHPRLHDALAPASIESLPVPWKISFHFAWLPEHHGDLADRIIIATALAYDARLARLESAFSLYAKLGTS